MEEQFDAVYNYLTRNQYPDGLTKDENIDCGLFSIAFAYHAAAGDNVKGSTLVRTRCGGIL